MSGLVLRGYQRETIDTVYRAWSGGMCRPAVVLPTGMGKTVIFADLIDRWLSGAAVPPRHDPNGAILVLVHREELADQTAEKIHMIDPDITVGVCKATRNELGGQVIIGSVLTLARRERRVRLPRIGLVIVDECHHAAADSYLKILDHVGALPARYCGCGDCQRAPRGALAVGFTATMSRSDNRGLGSVWQDVVYRKDIMYGVENGYLVDPRGKAIEIDGMDLARVARSGGDYQQGALGQEMTQSGATKVIAEKYKELAGDRQGIAFMPTVATAHGMAADFEATGITAAVVDGNTQTEDRRSIYTDVRSGKIQVIANCGVLTEGFDMPQISAIVPKKTMSASLYVQMVGRGLRPWNRPKDHPFGPKIDCLVLDPVGVTAQHNLAGMVDLSDKAVPPKDGESLSEAVERVAKETNDRELAELARARRLSGAVTIRDVELFHNSASAWLQTRKGIWFIPTRQCVFFLWPDGPETFKIGRTKTPYSAKGGSWVRDGLSLEYAMAFAEQFANGTDPTVSQRDRSWRKSKPSDTQRGLATRLGIQLEEGWRQGTVSDAISIHYASAMLDGAIKG